jgi:transposase
MAKIGRPTKAVVVTDDERRALIRLTGRARANRALAFRARLVLACADGMADSAVARRYRTKNATVGKWRHRFLARRLDGLYDEPRVGAPRRISDEAVEAVIVKTLETTPPGETHWSTRGMAAKAGMSHATIGRIWRTFGLKPHVTESFKISPDPQLIEKVRDVVGLYMNTPTNSVVFSFDEKSQIQALARAQPILPMDVGQPERRTHNYLRNGTLDLFAALNVATGEVLARCKQRHRAQDFVAFLREIEASVEAALEVHVVLDNLSAHRAPVVHRWLLRHPRFHLHFTPTSASWLNLVERWFAMITDQAIRRGSFASVRDLERAIMRWLESWNEDPRPFRWTKSARVIRRKIRDVQRTSETGH